MQIDKQIHEKLYTENQYGYEHMARNGVQLNSTETDYLERYGLKKEFEYPDGTKVPLAKMCINCQARHILKYKNNVSVKGDKPWQVVCKGVPRDLPPGSRDLLKKYTTASNMDEERAKLLVMSTVDPVAWAELMLGFTDKPNPETGEPSTTFLRWYQKEALRCNSRRMVLRWGRRSGKTLIMAVKLLYHIFNHLIDKGVDSEGNRIKHGPEIIVITPFQAQLRNIFNELEKLLHKNIDLSSKVTTKHAGSLYVQTPFFRMEFINGGSISGFVTGVEIRQDGSAAGSVRGQNANIVYIDEMDMIPPDVIEKVITPLLFTAPGTIGYATSTPIGRAGMFYNLCKDRPDYKEMHLPSTVLPHWDEVKAEIDYSDPTDDAFKSEFMAEFIESATGVFKTKYVYDAMRDFDYEDSDVENAAWWLKYAKVRDRSRMLTCIGIDWNKNAGSEFVVVKYDPHNHYWWVAEAINVTASEFNSVRFKEEVIRLNFKWRPDWIYADEGYGHHIIDDLLWEAHRILMNKAVNQMEQQTVKLRDRLKKFNFSSKVDLVDPVTNTAMQRTGKEFLVENAVRVFESERIRFPASDTTLKAQLLNYIVLRRHVSNNKPVYGMRTEKVGDHRLDALMLALGGLFLENHPLYSPKARTGLSQPGLLKREELEKRVEKNDDDDFLKHGIPGLHLEVTKFIRGNNEEENARVLAIQQAEQKQDRPGWFAENRGDFPTTNKKKSVFDELWERASSSKGFDKDEQALYAGRKRQPKHTKSDIYVTRKPRGDKRNAFPGQ